MPFTNEAVPQAQSRGGKTDALALLTADHKEVKKLFEAYESLVSGEGAEEEREALSDQICVMLLVHVAIEEEIFYPAARAKIPNRELLDEAEVEHAGAKDLIAQILGMEPGDELFDAKVKVLGESIDHLVKEEEDELFPQVKRSRLDLLALGDELAARKQQLMSDAGFDQLT